MRTPIRTAHNRFFALLLILVMFISGCIPVFDPPVVDATITPTSAIPLAGSPVDVYFTSPGSLSAGFYEGGPDEALTAAIDAAVVSVDVAIYNFNLWSIRDALIDAHDRGVTVRMVMESENMEADEVGELILAGIPVEGDRRQGLMHNKFVVIDRAEVWNGSMNFTVGGAYYDNNILLRIRSTDLAENFTREFEEMFLEDHYGPDDVADTPHPNISIDGVRVDTYFSPDDGVANRIISLIRDAKESVHFLAYSFTSDEIGGAILDASMNGLVVSGVMDAESASSNEGTEFELFQSMGLNVRLDGNEGLLHEKIIIIDEEIVITGSYNFTYSAEDDNDENVIIIYDPEVAARCMAEFHRMYSAAQP
jgi:phosphatidylserine/phosphatidylglycerophosphate/cardiolipin synthase-like enzyme